MPVEKRWGVLVPSGGFVYSREKTIVEAIAVYLQDLPKSAWPKYVEVVGFVAVKRSARAEKAMVKALYRDSSVLECLLSRLDGEWGDGLPATAETQAMKIVEIRFLERIVGLYPSTQFKRTGKKMRVGVGVWVALHKSLLSQKR